MIEMEKEIKKIFRIKDAAVVKQKMIDAAELIADQIDVLDNKEIYAASRYRYFYLSAMHENPQNIVEYELWVALYAYEEVLFEKHGRNQKAAKLRQSIEKRGIIETANRSVLKGDTSGFTNLVRSGHVDASFEIVVLKYPSYFDAETVSAAITNLMT